MRWRILAVAAIVGALVVSAATAAPGDLIRTNASGGNATQVPAIPGTPCWRVGSQVFRPEGTPFSACATPTTTTTTTTTVAPTTTTAAPTATTVAPTTTLPGAPQFVETFDAVQSLDRLDYWVYHRNVDLHEFDAFSGGTWTGDHSLPAGPGEACGTPDTTRPMRFDVGDNQTTRVANSIYWCSNAGGHFMSTMGDVDGYSIVTMSPRQTFTAPKSVCVDVNLTDLGTREWFKIGVVTNTLYSSRPADPDVPGFLVSDVDAADLPPSLATADRFIATWSGGVSAGYPGFLKLGNTPTGVQSNPSPNDKATRHPVCLVDNQNGTVTFTVAGVSATRAGAFPAGLARVVLYHHAYTPSKSESGAWGSTWHWDNLIVR